MIFYLDDFMTSLVKAHNSVATDQKKAVNIITGLISSFHPEDEDILYLLRSACDVGLDSPKKFKLILLECIDKINLNHNIMVKQYKILKSNSKKLPTSKNLPPTDESMD